jgi:enoyl-CoA hydratase/carnithine racemase
LFPPRRSDLAFVLTLRLLLSNRLFPTLLFLCRSLFGRNGFFAWNIAAPARCTKPVIAANRGYAFGVSFEISLACDFRIVSKTCQYALPEQKLGQIPGSGGSARSIAIGLGGHCYSRLRQSKDFREGIDAFHAERPPKFRKLVLCCANFFDPR